MRVLVLSADPGIPLYGPSGASAHLRGVARAFVARGDAVRVAVPRESDGRGLVDDPVPAEVVTSLPRRWSWVPRTWRERGEGWDSRRLVAAAVDGFVPDLVWERFSLFADGGKRLGQGRVAGIRTRRIVEVNAPLSIERARYGRIHNPAFAAELERAILTDGVERVVTVSAWLAEWAEEIGVDPRKIRHVPNGVDPQGPGDRDGTRARLGLDGLVIGFVGTMKPWHGLEALPALLDALPEATALVVGDGPVALPEHPRIRAVGRVSPRDLPDYVAAMDVGLAPYRRDAPPWFCPLKILAYKAQGVPVAAADHRECALLVADGSGRIAPTDLPNDWARTIREVAHLPRVRRLRSWETVLKESLAPGEDA